MTKEKADHYNYVGIDPGWQGALALVSHAGVPKVWDLPIYTLNQKKEYDLTAILRRLRLLKAEYPPLKTGLEWGTSRPGEQSERARRYGVGMGQLDAMLHTLRIDYARIPPVTWKTKLGLKGKDKKDWAKELAAMYDLFYPDHAELIRGPKGGIKDGRAEAVLIATYVRLMTFDGLKQLTQDQQEAVILGFGRTKFKGFS